ncbi:MAG: peptidoglycan DD-metalloendopeptidase family protein [Deltaproteobacteria bacterium]|nr:peptidoglycan DD-metalloendopeptidase family protein [Deltaproteobacteria bacterium]
MRQILFLLFLLLWATAFPSTLGLAGKPAIEWKQKIKQGSNYKYGLDVSGLVRINDSVKFGETIGAILKRYRVPDTDVAQAIKMGKGLIDFRHIKAGRTYCMIYDPRQKERIRYLVYESSPVDYLVFDFDDPVKVYKGQKAIQSRVRTISAVVTGSLWNALSPVKWHEALVPRLAELYGHSIDFYRLKNGDWFSVVFEENYAGGAAVGLGAIKGALFQHNGKDYPAFQFECTKTDGYFDEAGNSLVKDFLKAPVQYSRVSSGFASHRLHPILGTIRMHPAIDYAAPLGAPVMSVGDGIVLEVGYNKTAGRFIRIKHMDANESRYLHLSRFADGIHEGIRVGKGDIIGYVGSTGLATGPHLDFRFLVDGRYVDYTKLDLPPGPSIPRECANQFELQVARLTTRLLSANPS